jgi:hypothetical protein
VAIIHEEKYDEMRKVVERVKKFLLWEIRQHVNGTRRLSDRRAIQLLSLYRDLEHVWFDRNGRHG